MTILAPASLPLFSKAVVVHAAGDLRIDSVANAVPGPDEVTVKIMYGGICGSDLHYVAHGQAGDSVLKTPMVLGHEVVGRVVRAAADGTGPLVGTPVAVHPGATGNSDCYPTGRPNISPAGTYLGSAARFPHTDGAFMDYVNFPSRMLRSLPGNLDLRLASLAEPASVAWHAVSRAGDVRGKRILVVGSGPIGALIVAVLKRAGAAEIVAVDMHELPLRIAAELGATRALNAADDSEEISALAADVVLESSGSVQGLNSALRAVARGGRVVMVGLLPSGPQPLLISLAIAREIELVGSFRFNDEMDQVITALADGSLRAGPVVTHEFPATDAEHAFTVARDSSCSGKVLLRF